MSENVNEGLRSVAKKVVAYQFFSIIILILFTVVGSEFDLNILVFLGFFIVAICGIYILKILIFDENICPNCNKSFFKKEGGLSNLGFSIYTKNCTNCGYKLQK
ncbi:hypothetical protein GCM10025882_22260 [Acinetobacter gyllenbergii]|uniref:Uncharacterized protein n=1 Tax=Acinetobacter gyllenbergii CIP 110306 = MTCC 11365 TaxID=1217657 RepID=A0A829HE53_9GAMM|nr:hypothetical protein [Acinetobacter gyllenbergii]EPF71643.1 hypothetical protein F957_03829 [Acinetobacter gyllenbergii CIP 110306 = MTCC 11365]GMA11801.1 hypothetical protein GCM10025882_22260 [Acinetobacter gyllenbergii]